MYPFASIIAAGLLSWGTHANQQNMSQLILNQQLWAAVSRNDTPIVEAALVAGADPNFRDAPLDPTAIGACFSTHSVLHEACFLGHEASVALLLRHGAEQCQDGTYDLTPLHLACLTGRTDIVKQLVNRGGDLLATDGGGDTPLMCAMMGENPYASPPVILHEKMEKTGEVQKLLEYLIEAGANPNQANQAGETPLWNAIRYQSPQVTARLIALGGDVQQKTCFDTDLIAEAAQSLSSADVLSDIPQYRKEGNAMRKRILACLEVIHANGLAWRDLDAENQVADYPSETLYHQMKFLWNSMSASVPQSSARTASL